MSGGSWIRRRGVRKRKAGGFKSGCGSTRWTPKEGSTTDLNTSGQEGSPVLESLKAEDGRTLRSPRPKSSRQPAIKNKMRLVDIYKTKDMFKWAYTTHIKTQDCDDPDIDIETEKRVGVAIKVSLRCLNCDFHTHVFKLYDEVGRPGKRGTKPAVANIALMAALMYTAIGIQKLRTILNALDLPVPSESGMQKLANYVSESSSKVAKRGMREKLLAIAKKNKNELKAFGDTRHNTSTITSDRRTGLHNTSQAITIVMAEEEEKDETGELRKRSVVVAEHTQNKVCPTGTRLRLKGEHVECPGHPGCTANLNRFETMTERAGGEAIGEELANMGITVTHLTTDGDGKMYAGLQDKTPTAVKRLKDPVHLSRTQVHKGQKQEWSAGLFPGVRLRKEKTLRTRALANDMKNRSYAVLHQLHAKHKGNLDSIKAEAKKVIPAIICCYAGDCSHCRDFTTSCSGGESDDNWLVKSSLLQEYHLSGGLQMTQDDVDKMTDTLSMMLGEEAIDKTEFLSTTQQCESFNRTISVSLPKNTKYSRNLAGRLGCAVEVWNWGEGEAQARQRTDMNLPPSGGQVEFLKRRQRRWRWKQTYNKALSTKLKVRKRCTLLRQGKREYKPKLAPDYKKHHLDDSLDHNYPVSSLFFICLCIQTCNSKDKGDNRHAQGSVRLKRKLFCLD